MATAAITNAYRVDNYAAVQLLQPLDISVGNTFTVASVGTAYNGSGLVVVSTSQWELTGVDDQGELQFSTVSQIPNQVIYYKTGDTETLHAVIPNGTLTYTPTCTWVTGTEVATWLGLSYASDTAFLDQCAAAANQFCFRRRQEAGYFTDTPGTVPSADVKLGVIMYAGGALYRQRGAIDQFASFSEMGTAPVTGLSPQIKQLLGIGRPQVA